MPEALELILSHDLFPLAAVVLVVVLIIFAYINGTKRERFEEKLATSTINSITVGLVEVVGHVRAINQCEIPLFKRSCVGYSYIIERIRTDSDSKRDSYHQKYAENHIEPFFIEDHTGSVLVEPEGMVADGLREDTMFKTGYRHRCSYLKDGQKVMIIGRAQPRNSELVLEHDEQNKIFTLTPYTAVIRDRAMKPLMTRCILYFLIASIATSLILFF